MPKKWKTMSAALAGCLLVAACSSSSHKTSSGTTTPTTGAAAATQPTGTTLLIGTIESETGGGSAGRVTTAVDTLNAWVKWTNAHGGIDGHPVKLIALNDNADPAAARSDLTQLIVADNVLAIVGDDASATEPTWSQFVLAHRTPVIGGNNYSTNAFTNPMFYAGMTTVLSQVYGQVYAAKQAAATPRLGSLLCNNATICEGAVQLIKAAAQQLGVPLVFNETASPTAVSYTPQCLAMKEAGVNVVIPTGVGYVNFIRSCNQQNFHPTVVLTGYGPTPAQVAQNPVLAGVIGDSATFPPFQGFPQTAQYFQILQQYTPQYLPGGSLYGIPSQLSLVASVEAYVSGQIFAKAVENAGIPANGTVTRPDLIQGLSMFKNETLGGIVPPLTYSDGTKPNPQVTCFYLYKAVTTSVSSAGYQMIPPSQLKLYCQPPASP